MATRTIDDIKLNNIAIAIQAKDNGGQMTIDEMPTRIENILTGSGDIPISVNSDTPIFFGINDDGVYMCTTESEATDVAFGRDGMLVYAESV